MDVLRLQILEDSTEVRVGTKMKQFGSINMESTLSSGSVRAMTKKVNGSVGAISGTIGSAVCSTQSGGDGSSVAAVLSRPPT